MLSTPNLVFIDGHLSHKVTVFIYDANWKKQWNTFLGERCCVSSRVSLETDGRRRRNG